MIWEATIAIGKLVGYFYILFVIILIGMIGIAGLLRILIWLNIREINGEIRGRNGC